MFLFIIRIFCCLILALCLRCSGIWQEDLRSPIPHRHRGQGGIIPSFYVSKLTTKTKTSSYCQLCNRIAL